MNSRANLSLPLGLAFVLAGLALNPWLFIGLAPDGDIQSPVILGAIVVFDLACIGFGLWLVIRRPRVGVADLLLATVAVLLVLLTLETALRLGIRERGGTMELDPVLGWAPKADFRRVLRDDPVYGRVVYTTTRDGFRRFGAVDTDATRILFLGDSYTQAIHVTDGEVYYDRIGAARPDVEVFAFGAGGYGTLQEYMVLDQFADEIRPDIVVLQFTPNDMINNTFELESHSAIAARMTRPYLEDGEIVRRFPSRNPLLRHSLLARFISIRLGFLGLENQDRLERSIEFRLEDEQERWAESVETTRAILRRLRERAGDATVLAFQVGPAYVEPGLYPRLSAEAGIHFADGLQAALDSAQEAGVAIDWKPHDGHWSGQGNGVAADYLLRFMTGEGYLEPLPD